MRRILAVTLSALILLAWTSLRPAGAGPAPRFAVGDVNGDGGLDISDPIFLLRHIFADGPPPVVQAGTLELEERIARLEARELTDAERELLGYFSLGWTETGVDWMPPARTVVLTGVNFQIVNGLPRQSGTNGAGNLILGEQRLRSDYFDKLEVPDNRIGSHNIVVGDFNNYMGDNGVVTGEFNAIGDFGYIIGGSQSTASGYSSVIIGGSANVTEGDAAVVSGGVLNRAIGDLSTITGGIEVTTTERGQVAP